MLPKIWAQIFGWVVTAVAVDESFDYVSGNILYPLRSTPDVQPRLSLGEEQQA